MNLSKIIESGCQGYVYRECDFEDLALFGKPRDMAKRSIGFVMSPAFIEDFLKEDVVGVICTEPIKDLLKDSYDGGIFVCDNPKTCFFKFFNVILCERKAAEQKFPTKIGANTQIDETAIIAPLNVTIGDNVSIGPYTIIKENTVICDKVCIMDHCVIGGPAFFYYEDDDKIHRVESIGGVYIGENAELHSHCVVERSAFSGYTTLGDNVKLDNFTLIGHDTQMGRKTLSAASSTFAGYVNVGEEVFFGVSATVAPSVKICDGAKVSAGAVVTRTVEPNTHVSGNFAIEHNKFLKNLKDIR